jgi:hypothetical protein
MLFWEFEIVRIVCQCLFEIFKNCECLVAGNGWVGLLAGVGLQVLGCGCLDCKLRAGSVGSQVGL